MAATEQEMMERAARIQTIEELREACAEFGVEMSPEDEQAFMAAKAELRELSEGELDASVGGSGFFGPGSTAGTRPRTAETNTISTRRSPAT